jgi:hypothetical protein
VTYRCPKGHTDITVICGRCGEPMQGPCCRTVHPPIYWCADCERDVEATADAPDNLPTTTTSDRKEKAP